MDSHQKVREMESSIASLRREGRHSEAMALYDEMARGVRRIWRDEVQSALARW
jgi:hypothetical protein